MSDEINYATESGVNELKKKLSFSTVGIIIGIFLVIMSLVWVAITVISGSEQSAEDITWVG